MGYCRLCFLFMLAIVLLSGCGAESSLPPTTNTTMNINANVTDPFAVRKPIAQGFYPADAEALSKALNNLFSMCGTASADKPVQAIITPHAGYEYSGVVAAAAYQYAYGREINTVVIIGPSHRVAFSGFSIWPRGVWQMPGFETAVDTNFSTKLLQDNAVVELIQPQQHEHSLEVQIPFINHHYPKARIVPIVAGRADETQVERLLASLLKASEGRDDILLVATCDLSHYHTRTEARRLDDRACKLMASFDSDDLIEADANGEIEIDAPNVVALAQRYAQARGAGTARVLMRRDSGDATGDTTAVVGYGAFAFE